jgi:hypothetical protein
VVATTQLGVAAVRPEAADKLAALAPADRPALALADRPALAPAAANRVELAKPEAAAAQAVVEAAHARFRPA